MSHHQLTANQALTAHEHTQRSRIQEQHDGDGNDEDGRHDNFSGQDKDLEVRASALSADELMPFIQMKEKQQCSTLKWRTICFTGICLSLMDSI